MIRRLTLLPHPDTPTDAIASVEVDTAQEGGGLTLRYRVAGQIDALLVPAPAPSGRADGLWQHTCFEAFLMDAGGAYREFNFSPSGRWAAYDFDAYRSGMAEAGIASPHIQVRREPERFELWTVIAFPAGSQKLGLSAVIEETNGRKSYWALAHPAGKPDFHHPDSFVHELP